MKWTYTIITRTIPAAIDPVDFYLIVGRAMRYVEKSSGDQVRFTPMEAENTRHVNIGFGEICAPGKIAEQAVRNTTTSICFDSKTKWGTKWHHKWFTRRPDLYTLAVHELGHLLGLHHSTYDDPSVMDESPLFAEFSEREKEQLVRLTKDIQPCCA